jgi:hypothetical protein
MNQFKRSKQTVKKSPKLSIDPISGILLSEKEYKWVWELHYAWKANSYIAYNRATKEERVLQIMKDDLEVAAARVQAMNFQIEPPNYPTKTEGMKRQ